MVTGLEGPVRRLRHATDADLAAIPWPMAHGMSSRARHPHRPPSPTVTEPWSLPSASGDTSATARGATGVHAIPHPVRRLFGESRGVTWAVGLLLLLVGMMLVRPMAMSLLSWHRTAALLEERRTEVRQLEQRNERLTAQVDFFRTNAYVIEQARTLGMVAPGERSFVIRELAHPGSASRYATSRLRNVTVDHPATLAAAASVPASAAE